MVFTFHVEHNVGTEMPFHTYEFNRITNLGIRVCDLQGDGTLLYLLAGIFINKRHHEMVGCFQTQLRHGLRNILDVSHPLDTFADLAADNNH